MGGVRTNLQLNKNIGERPSGPIAVLQLRFFNSWRTSRGSIRSSFNMLNDSIRLGDVKILLLVFVRCWYTKEK